MTVTTCPTMCNPDTISSIQELRDELRKANAAIMEQSLKLHETCILLNCVTTAIGNVVFPYTQGDKDKAHQELDKFISKYVLIPLVQGKGQVH
ncbi:MAG: hypothetical protein ACRDD3_11190 [Azovibrio sp.]